MASLIFGAIYVGHHAVVGHRREKQRVKNYERWEGLRDEYDEQRKVQRETRSLDIQRTGHYGDFGGSPGGGYNGGGLYEDKPILTLRDQQEANDARTSWRPQESFTPMHTGAPNPQQYQQQEQPGRPPPQSMDIYSAQGYGHQRAVSDMNSYTSHQGNGLGIHQPQQNGYQQDQNGYPTQQPGIGMRKLPAQMTGTNWDDGLPQPLRVNRQMLDDSSTGVARSNSAREYSSRTRGSPLVSSTPRNFGGSSESLNVPKRNGNSNGGSRSPSIPEERAEPIENQVPGGRMAALIEEYHVPEATGARVVSAPMPTTATFPASANGYPNANGAGQRDMEEWWSQGSGTAQRPAPVTNTRGPREGDMQEWWK